MGKKRRLPSADMTNPDGDTCEPALVVGDEWRRMGIGTRIMASLMDMARIRGLNLMEGEVLIENSTMLSLAKKLGFTVRPCENDPTCNHITKRL